MVPYLTVHTTLDTFYLIALNALYKITKIVRAPWLAERSVCMRVCKHGCDVRCFAFRALITQAGIWKSFSDENSTSLLYLPNPSSAETWLNLYNQAVSTFFLLTWHFKRETSVSWKPSFCKSRTDSKCKTLQLVRISLLIIAITKSFAFLLRNVIL